MSDFINLVGSDEVTSYPEKVVSLERAQSLDGVLAEFSDDTLTCAL